MHFRRPAVGTQRRPGVRLQIHRIDHQEKRPSVSQNWRYDSWGRRKTNAVFCAGQGDPRARTFVRILRNRIERFPSAHLAFCQSRFFTRGQLIVREAYGSVGVSADAQPASTAFRSPGNHRGTDGARSSYLRVCIRPGCRSAALVGLPLMASFILHWAGCREEV